MPVNIRRKSNLCLKSPILEAGVSGQKKYSVFPVPDRPYFWAPTLIFFFKKKQKNCYRPYILMTDPIFVVEKILKFLRWWSCVLWISCVVIFCLVNTTQIVAEENLDFVYSFGSLLLFFRPWRYNRRENVEIDAIYVILALARREYFGSTSNNIKKNPTDRHYFGGLGLGTGNTLYFFGLAE